MKNKDEIPEYLNAKPVRLYDDVHHGVNLIAAIEHVKVQHVVNRVLRQYISEYPTVKITTGKVVMDR